MHSVYILYIGQTSKIYIVAIFIVQYLQATIHT
jgi:hypothetical protein